MLFRSLTVALAKRWAGRNDETRAWASTILTGIAGSYVYDTGKSVEVIGNEGNVVESFAYNKRSLTSRRLRRLDAHASVIKHGLSNQVIDAKQLGDLRSRQQPSGSLRARSQSD